MFEVVKKYQSPSSSSKCGDEVNQACRAAVITTKDGKVEFQRSCCKGDDCKTVHADADGGHLDQVRYNNKHFYEPELLSSRKDCPANKDDISVAQPTTATRWTQDLQIRERSRRLHLFSLSSL